MDEKLYSLRMRAAKKEGNTHISGAESIILWEEIDKELNKLLERVFNHSRGKADIVKITLEVIDKRDIKKMGSLPITSVEVEDYREARKIVKDLLIKQGVSMKAINNGLNFLANGASPDGKNMRGAILMQADSGERLERNHFRGVRVSCFDYTREIKDKLLEMLSKNYLNKSHLPDALALATKVVSHPAVLAELCYSDDPDYTAGYLASLELGYYRFSSLKPYGSMRGGRVFFLNDTFNLEEVINYLEKKPVLINVLNTQVNFVK